MASPFHAVYERDGKWYIGYCLEVPGANGQGRTKRECRESLRAAIELILESRRDDARRGLPRNATIEAVEMA